MVCGPLCFTTFLFVWPTGAVSCKYFDVKYQHCRYGLDGRIGALIVRIGVWGPLCYNYTKEPPQNSIGKSKGPYIMSLEF